MTRAVRKLLLVAPLCGGLWACGPGPTLGGDELLGEESETLRVSLPKLYTQQTTDNAFSRGDAVLFARAVNQNGARPQDFTAARKVVDRFSGGNDGTVKDVGGVTALKRFLSSPAEPLTPFDVSYVDPFVRDDIRPQVISVIASAKRSLDLAIFEVKDEPVIGALEEAVGRGVKLRIVTDNNYFRSDEAQAELDQRVSLKGRAVELYKAIRALIPAPGAEVEAMLSQTEALEKDLTQQDLLFPPALRISLDAARTYLLTVRGGAKPSKDSLRSEQSHLDDELRWEETRAKFKPAYNRLVAVGAVVRNDTTSALSHNKYLVVDSRRVWTGSYNLQGLKSTQPAFLGLDMTADNALVIDSTELAKVFTDDFEEMHAGRFQKAKLGGYGGTPLWIDSVRVTPYFSPTDTPAEKLADKLESSAKARAAVPVSRRRPMVVRMAAFSAFANGTERVLDALVRLKRLGADVEVRLDGMTATASGSSLWKLRDGNVRVDITRWEVMMHHKFLSVQDGDDGFVWTGSANFTRPGSEENDESVLLLESPELAAAYEQIYNSLTDDLKQ
ncbi:MAG: phospholipase D-like domain-containing protein [Myxococcaceae bacterium]